MFPPHRRAPHKARVRASLVDAAVVFVALDLLDVILWAGLLTFGLLWAVLAGLETVASNGDQDV